MEVIDDKERAAPTAGEPVGAASASGLRFAEDIAPAMAQPASAKKAKKAGKKERQQEGEGVKAKSPKRSKRFAVLDEDEDFESLLEDYVEPKWDSDEEEESS
jgi:hypothetical protein